MFYTQLEEQKTHPVFKVVWTYGQWVSTSVIFPRLFLSI